MLKQVIYKLGLLMLVLYGMNILYTFFFYEKDMMELSPEIHEIRKTLDSTQVYYFAESSNINARDDDSIKNSISEMAHMFFPSLKFTSITKPASHAGIFKVWLKELKPEQGKPKALVVTLNLRSFDAAWIHSKMESQLQESLVFTYPFPNVLNRFLLSLQVFDNKTEQQREKIMDKEWKSQKLRFPFKFRYKTAAEWNFNMANGGHVKADGSWDVEKSTLACHYIKAYAFNLNESNPRIKDFDEIVGWCRNNGLMLYLNLMAENMEYADSLVGKELVFLMKQNRDYLVKRYSSPTCKVIDNLELVPGIDFTDQDWTTEHYGYKGRMSIARQLANGMKEQFKSAYLNAY